MNKLPVTDIEIPEEIPHWQLFAHASDMGVRGFGATRKEAFEQCALALTAMVTELKLIETREAVSIACSAPDIETLLLDYLNLIIYEMSIRKMLFNRFEVTFEDTTLEAKIWGEKVDKAKHNPAVEPKGATYTELKVVKLPENIWVAQCIVDV